mgnify:FL=1
MTRKQYEKCPDCGTEDLEFRAWVDKYQNFSEWDENDKEAWCTKCEEFVSPEPL